MGNNGYIHSYREYRDWMEVMAGVAFDRRSLSVYGLWLWLVGFC